jgi:Uma2 family endonuclease
MGTLAVGSPSLESGDHLTLAEFWRRYQLRSDINKAEYIDGAVYVASPVRFHDHGLPHGLLVRRLGLFCDQDSRVQLGDNATLRLPEDNVQPDVMLRLDERAGGRSRIDADGYVVGVPEFVAEVAASSASYDLHEKKALYERTGIPEYVVWRVEDEAIDWFVLEGGRYVALEPGDDGLMRSRVFPRLALDLDAMLATFRAALAKCGLEP